MNMKMLDSFKDKLYSVVQDGLRDNKKHGDNSQSQSRVSGTGITTMKSTCGYSTRTGAELLEYYQNQWKQMHNTAEINAGYAHDIDITMCQIHDKVKKQLDTAVEMSSLLSELPRVIDTVEQCNSQLKKLNENFRKCEDVLISLESVIEQIEFKRRQQEHQFQLTMYKEKKLLALEQYRMTLASKQAENMRQLEQKQRQLLSEKQKAANELFENDLQQFKLEGKLPERIRHDPTTTVAASLEEIVLDDDSSELDDFLNR